MRLRTGLTCGVFLRVFDHYKYSAAGVFEQSMPRARLIQIYILTSNLSTTYRLTWRRYILIFNLPIMANIAFVKFLWFINWDIPNYLWRCLQVQVSGIQFWHFWLKSCSLSKLLVFDILMMTVSVHSELYCFSTFTIWWILRVFVHRKSVPCTLHFKEFCFVKINE